MRHICAIILIILALAAQAAWAGEGGTAALMKDIHWLGHDTFKITSGGKVIYTDPFRLKHGDAADIILITHEHYDHCSPEDVARIQKSNTVIVTVADCAAKLSGNVKTVRPGDKLVVGGVSIEAVPAYNIGKKFHPQANKWVGYIFSAGDRRIYIAGDTDRIPEMKSIRCDIALLPVGGTYTMTAEEAALAALDIKPKVAVPMHYGTLTGTPDDAKRFAAALKGKIDVVILPQE